MSKLKKAPATAIIFSDFSALVSSTSSSPTQRLLFVKAISLEVSLIILPFVYLSIPRVTLLSSVLRGISEQESSQNATINLFEHQEEV